MHKYAEKFYKGRAWQSCRESYLKKTHGLCEECLKHGYITPATEVHHIKPITKHTISNPNITLNHENLMSLCKQHHAEKHRKSIKRYVIDEYGHISPNPEYVQL